MKTIRVLVPMDLKVDEAHLQEVFSPEWRKHMYSFQSDRQFAMYVARLMLVGIETCPLSRFDGHAHQLPNVASLELAPMDDDDWSIDEEVEPPSEPRATTG